MLKSLSFRTEMFPIWKRYQKWFTTVLKGAQKRPKISLLRFMGQNYVLDCFGCEKHVLSTGPSIQKHLIFGAVSSNLHFMYCSLDTSPLKDITERQDKAARSGQEFFAPDNIYTSENLQGCQRGRWIEWKPSVAFTADEIIMNSTSPRVQTSHSTMCHRSNDSRINPDFCIPDEVWVNTSCEAREFSAKC